MLKLSRILGILCLMMILLNELSAQTFQLTCNDKPIPICNQNDVPLSYDLDTYKYARVSYFGKPLSLSIEAINFQFGEKEWNISPHSYGIEGTKKGNTLTFKVNRKGYLVIRFSSSYDFKKYLVIFIEEPELPIKGEIVDVVGEYGIDNSGETNETVKIQKALDEISGTGKTLYFTDGIYKTSMFQIRSNSNIHLSKNATIKADPEQIESYLAQGNKGINRFIYIADVENIHITGLGTFDGSGSEILGMTLPEREDTQTKIRLIFILRSKNVTFDGIILKDAASWNTHLMGSQDIAFRNCKLLNTTVNNDYFGSLDGWDPDASQRVLIEDCFGWAGDDNVAVKCTGYGNLGIYDDVEDITVRGCVFMTKKTSLKIGTETRCENYKNIVFEDNDVIEADRVLGINVRDRAKVSGVLFKDIRSEYCYPDRRTMPINIYITRREKDQAWTGKIQNVMIENCSFETQFPRKIEVRRIESHTEETDLYITFKGLSITGKAVNTLDPAYFHEARCNGIIRFQ